MTYVEVLINYSLLVQSKIDATQIFSYFTDFFFLENGYKQDVILI